MGYFPTQYAPANMRSLRYFAFSLEFFVLAWLIATEGIDGLGMLAILVAGGVAVTTIAAAQWPNGSLFLLIASSAVPRLTWKLFGLHLRPEHVAVGVVSAMSFLHAKRNTSGNAVQLRSFDYFLIAYILINFFTSAFTSPEPHMTLRWAAMNAVVITPFFLLRWLIRSSDDAWLAAKILLFVGAVESAIGIGCYLSNALFHTTAGVTVAQYGVLPGTYGTQYEANILGSYAGCCAVLFLAFFLRSPAGKRNWYLVGLILSFIATIISFARAALLALPVAAVFVLWTTYKGSHAHARSLLRVLPILAVALIAISPFAADALKERFAGGDIDQLMEDGTTFTRMVQMAVGVEDVQSHPILGTGTASFQLLFNWEDYMPDMAGDTEVGGWLSNTPLRVLHDTGIVGLLIFLLFLGYLVNSARKTFKVADPNTKTLLVALSGGLILYSITFQATEATMLAFTWTHLGIFAAVVEVSRQKISSQAPS